MDAVVDLDPYILDEHLKEIEICSKVSKSIFFIVSVCVWCMSCCRCSKLFLFFFLLVRSPIWFIISGSLNIKINIMMNSGYCCPDTFYYHSLMDLFFCNIFVSIFFMHKNCIVMVLETVQINIYAFN